MEPPLLQYRPIGVVRSPFLAQAGTPVQAVYSEAEGVVELWPEYADALEDLAGFERVLLLYHLDRAPPFRSRVVPYLERGGQTRGLFATRSPPRPNPIGLSVLRLLGVSGSCLRVAGLDVLDQTPVLDVKPYVPTFDAFPESRAGWFDAVDKQRTEADDRFAR